MLDWFTKIMQHTKVEVLAFLISLLIPITPGLMIMGFFIFADTFTGIWSAIQFGGWKGFESRKFTNGLIPKLVMYPLVLMIASASELIFPEIPFIRGGLFLLMCMELKSLEENFSKILKVKFLKLIKVLVLKGRKGLLEELSKEDNIEITIKKDEQWTSEQ